MTELTLDIVNEILRMGKTINNDILWKRVNRHNYEFKQEIDIGYPFTLQFNGTFNILVNNYKFALIYQGERIAGMCVGKDHHNPTCQHISGSHIHIWNEEEKDSYAEKIEFDNIEKIEHGLNFFCERNNIYINGTVFWPEGYQVEVIPYAMWTDY